MTKIEALKFYIESMQKWAQESSNKNDIAKEYYTTCAKTFEVVLNYVKVVEEDPTLE